MTRIAIVAPDDWTIWLFYRHLVAELRAEGAQITVFTAKGPHIPRLIAIGVEHVAVPYARFVDPVQDLRLYLRLRHEFAERGFDAVQNITIKANLYGALAASAARIAVIINTVEGAGLLYSDSPSVRVRGIRALAELGLRRARPHVTRYWFVNENDRDVFVKRRLADPNRSVVAIATGVDTSLFDPMAVPETAVDGLREELAIPKGTALVVNVAGRLLRSKGIGEFVQAARDLKKSQATAQFVLVGPEEPDNPDAFPIDLVRDAVSEGVIRWIPFREDVWTIYRAATVAVVPSYYAEGTPKGVLEGMAMACPLVCSDVPSIRALVTHEADGILVPPRSGSALAKAIAALLAAPEVRARMGRAARSKAVKLFDAEVAARAAVIKVYGGLGVLKRGLAPPPPHVD